jgi:hypothetical protein
MTIRRGIALGSAAFYFLILNCPVSRAQFTSSIEGTVTDPSGAALPNAMVVIRNEETGATQTVNTSAAGYYRFTALSAAVFTVRITAPGFKTRVEEHIRVQVSETKTVNISMELGATESEVTVTAEAPVIETSQGRVSGMIEEAKIKDLPLPGRNFYTLVVLTPGVTGVASGGGQAYAQATGDIFEPEYGVNLNANGARSESNSFLVDSASINSSQRNGVTNINPNAEDVQEVRVSVNNFSAEYGRNGAALVNIITKQGTNAFHGGLSFYHTNNRLQSRNEFQAKVPVFRRNEGAASFGGPIRRDHTFFYVSTDILRSGVAFGRAASIATPQFIQYMTQNFPNNTSTKIWRDFPASVTPDRNFITAGQMAGATCSGSTVIPTEVGNIPCNLPVTGVGNFSTSLPRNGEQWTARVDHMFNNSKDRLYGSANRTTTERVLFNSPFVYPAFNNIEPTYSIHFNADWTHTFSATVINEFGSSFTRPFGNAILAHPEVPGITVTGIDGFQQGWGPNQFVQTNFEFRDIASVTRSAHTLKFGGGVTRERADHESSRVFNRPVYSFQSVFDFAADQGCPTCAKGTAFSSSQNGFDPKTGQRVNRLLSLIRTGSIAGFVQDDWKVRPNLTLNLGFRWENYFNPSDGEGPLGIENMTFPANGDWNTRIAGGVMNAQSHLLNHTQNTYSPRFGFAWDPTKTGKMSVRGGFGIFWDRVSNQLFDGEFTNTPLFAIASTNINTPAAGEPTFGLGTTSAPPYNFPLPKGLQAGLDSHNGLAHGRADVTVIDPNLKNMMLLDWFFGIQRSLTNDLVVEVNYIGSGARHAYVRYNVNRYAGDLIQHQGTFTGLQSGFGAITLGQSRESTSYHGGTVALKKRFRRGFSFDAAYTTGKAIDQSSTLAGSYVDSLNSKLERGLADFDIRHKLAFTALWELPHPPGDGMLNKLFGGWEINNVTILQSGTPFRPICTQGFRAVFDANRNVIGNTACDYNADGINFDAPNTPAFGNSLTGLSRTDFINGIFKASDFPAPALGRQGDLGRNTFRGPGFANTDFSVMKRMKFPWLWGTEGASAQLKGEFFNLFNRVNLTQVNNNLSSPFFGKSTSTFGARDIQFSLRVQF